MKYAIAFLLLLLGLAACGSDPAPACEIADNGDGTRTISCPGADPVVVVDGDADAVCTIGSGDDGGKVISCSDGTLVRIDPDGRVIFPGSGMVVGTARLFGKDGHGGIRVFAEGTEIETTTGEDGRFELGPLPAGIYVLHFEAPGRVTEKRENVPVINNEWRIKEPVVLRIGRWVGGDWVDPAPGGDAVLIHAFTATRAWLDLLELEDMNAETQTLSGVATNGAFSRDGAFVLVQERTALDGPLWLIERATGEKTMVAERSVHGRMAPDAALVAYETLDVEGGCHMHLWRRESGTSAEIGACGPAPTGFVGASWAFSPDGRYLIYSDPAGVPVIHDVTGGPQQQLPIAAMRGRLDFLGGSTHLLVFEQPGFASAGGWGIHDFETGSYLLIGPDAIGDLLVGGGGEAFVFSRFIGDGQQELVLHEVAEETNVVLATGGFTSGVQFSPDGRRILWIESNAATNGRLVVFDRESPENRAAYTARSAWNARFVGVGTAVALIDDAGEMQLWDPVEDEVELVGIATGGWSWNEDSTHFAIGSPAEGEVLLADLTDGSRHRVASDLGGVPVFEPDGAAVVFNRSINREEGTWELVRWEPPAEPVAIGQGFADSLFVTPGGTTLFLECEPGCMGSTLVGYDRALGERVPVDAPVATYRHENGVLIYNVTAPAEESHRNGFHVARVP